MSAIAPAARPVFTLLGCLTVAGLGAGLIVALPWFLGVSWAAIGANLAAVPVVLLVGLLVLWFAGLVVHAPVLMAALPGLGVRQALTLNLSGSAVSNVLPVGGPAGMGLGYAMARSWGFRSDAFASYTVATNLWNALGKFVIGLGVLAVAAMLGVGLPSGLGPVVISASAFMSAAAGTAFLAFRTERATVQVGHRLDRIHRFFRRGAAPDGCATWLMAIRAQLVAAVRRSWKVMTAGVLTYLTLQALLLWACLTAVGAGVPAVVVVVAFAIERLISLAPITPGAAGVAELGTVAALHSFGVDPVSAAAGVLLYRFLVFAIEIPIGGGVALVWVNTRRRRRAHGPDVAPAPSDVLVPASPMPVEAPVEVGMEVGVGVGG